MCENERKNCIFEAKITHLETVIKYIFRRKTFRIFFIFEIKHEKPQIFISRKYIFIYSLKRNKIN